MKYDAFISYSHAEDRELAARLKSALSRFAKPWHRIRALRVFLDATSLSANPGLWSAIETSLGESKRFVLLASPKSANSKWVQKEVDWWLANRSPKDLIIVLTGGRLLWEGERNDFDWSATDALPRNLAGAFPEEPLYVDLSWARTSDELSIRHSCFRAAVLDVAAPLRGIPKDELDSEEIRQNRRVRVLTGVAITLLVVLAIGATIGALVAYRQQQVAIAERIRADEQRDLATTRELTAQARLAESSGLSQRALLLATEAVARTSPPEPRAEQVLRDQLARFGGTPLIADPPETEAGSTRLPPPSWLSQDGLPRMWAITDRWILTDAGLDHIALWDRTRIGPDWRPTLVDVGSSLRTGKVSFSDDGRWLQLDAELLLDLSAAPAEIGRYAIGAEIGVDVFTGFAGNRLLIDYYRGSRHLYELVPGQPPNLLELRMPDGKLREGSAHFSPDGRWLVSFGEKDFTAIWDLEGDAAEPTVMDGRAPRGIRFAADGSGAVLFGLGETRFVSLPPQPGQAIVLSEQTAHRALFSADGEWLFAWPRLWRMRDALPVDPPVLLETDGDDRRQGEWQFSADGKWLVGRSTALRLWRMGEPLSPTPAFEFPIDSSLHPGHEWVLTRPDDARPALVEPDTGRRVDLRDVPVADAGFSADGAVLFVLYEDRLLQRLPLSEPRSPEDLARVGPRREFVFSPLASGDFVIGPQGTWVFAGGLLVHADPSAEARARPVTVGATEIARFSDDGRWFIARDDQSHRLRVYDLRDPERIPAPALLEGHDGAMGFSYLGNDWLLSHSGTSRGSRRLYGPRLWNLARPGAGATPRVLACEGHVWNGRFSPDGKSFAASGGDTLATWSLDEYRPVARVVEVDTTPSDVPQFSEDGRRVAVSHFKTFVVDLDSDADGVHISECREPRFSPDSGWLAMTHFRERCLLALDAASPASRVEKFDAESLHFAADGRLVVVRKIQDEWTASARVPGEADRPPDPLMSSAAPIAVDSTGRWLSSGDGQLVDLLDGRRFELEIVPHPGDYREVHSSNTSSVSIEISADGRWAVPLRRTREGYPEFGTWTRYAWQHVYDLESSRPERTAVSLPQPMDTLVSGFAGNRAWVSVDAEKVMHRLPFSGRGALELAVIDDAVPGEDPSLSPAGRFVLSTDDGRVHLTATDGSPALSGRLPDYEPAGFGQFDFDFGPGDDVLVTHNENKALVWRMTLPAGMRWPLRIGERVLDISPDGRWLATSHQEGVALHPLDPGELVETARAVSGRDFSDTERQEFLRE